MPSSKAAKKKQRLKKAAAERDAGTSEMTNEDITALVSALEPKSYEQVIVDSARQFGDVADMVVSQHQSLLKIRAHERTLVTDFAQMTKAIDRSLGVKYHDFLASTTAENRLTQVRKYAKKLVSDIDAALNYMTAEITSDWLYATKLAALDSIRSVLESILRSPKPLLSAMSRQPEFKNWDVKLMVVLKHFSSTDMCKLNACVFSMRSLTRRCSVIGSTVPLKEFCESLTPISPSAVPSQTEASLTQNPTAEPEPTGLSESASSSEPVEAELPKKRLTKEELKNMVSPLFPAVLEQIMTYTALAHPSVISALRAVQKVKAAKESSLAQGWNGLTVIVHNGLNNRYRIRKTYRHTFSVHAYASESVAVIEGAFTQIYVELRNVYKPLLSTKIAALDCCRKILEDVLRCPEELKDAICFDVGPAQTNAWAFNLLKVLDCFEDEEIYKLVRGETDEPDLFWTKLSVPALMELVKSKAPVGHPDRREFFRIGIRELWFRVYHAVIKFGPPPQTLMFDGLCVCCYCEDSDEEDYCSCGNGEDFDEDDDESLLGAMLGLTLSRFNR
ncbi:hypothetical protein QBC41DRAFT_387505 [Cercophora samala]|uniref:Uncharacterized protein n=1 Tax=Cercophora samala TaxID=330535 RepID=A0AA39ZGS5_9PEZI|nr:hypothetical protein QBC41DRAFT_387505 [Cercophora samala]